MEVGGLKVKELPKLSKTWLFLVEIVLLTYDVRIASEQEDNLWYLAPRSLVVPVHSQGGFRLVGARRVFA